MTEIRFYHLTSTALEKALPEILSKAVEREYRVVVKTDDPNRVKDLDTLLWTYDAHSFLPHGHIKNGTEKDHAIFLTTEDENPNDANMLMLIDGVTSDRLKDFELCCTVFDGEDKHAVEQAREQWKTLKDQGFDMTYFQQDAGGRWVKK